MDISRVFRSPIPGFYFLGNTGDLQETFRDNHISGEKVNIPKATKAGGNADPGQDEPTIFAQRMACTRQRAAP